MTTTTIGEFEVLGELGRGGAGVVYRARAADGREVALKLLLEAGGARERRLEREAQALAALRHPGIVPLIAEGEHQGRPYLVTELIPGESLQARLDRGGALPTRSAASLTRDLARALAHAHAHGVLHRDVKPANVLLATDGAARLVDFGLARAVEGSSLTHSGQLLGTPGFWSPEQARGERALTPATDVYGLGATFYAALTGRAPFEGGSWHELLVQTQSRRPERPSRLCRGLDPALEALCLSCLAKVAERRPTLAHVEQELTAWLDGAAQRRRRRGPRRLVVALAGVSGAVALAAAGWWSSRPAGPAPTTSAAPAPAPSPAPAPAPAPPPPPDQPPVVPSIDPALERDAARAASQRAQDEVVRLLAQDDPAAALPHAEEAIRLAPFNGTAHGVLASTLLQLKRPADALAAVEDAYAAEEPVPPHRLDAVHGFALQALGRKVEAAACLGRAYAAALPDPAPALAFQYGCCLRDIGRGAEAVEPLERAARSGRLGWQADFNLGGALKVAKRPEEALAAYQRARRSPSYGGYFAHLREAELLLDRGRPAEALRLLDEVLASPAGAASQRSHEFVAAVAQAIVRNGGPPGTALETALRALRLEGGQKNDRAHEARVEALLALGRRDEARAAIDEALLVFPGHTRLLEHARGLLPEQPEQR